MQHLYTGVVISSGILIKLAGPPPYSRRSLWARLRMIKNNVKTLSIACSRAPLNRINLANKSFSKNVFLSYWPEMMRATKLMRMTEQQTPHFAQLFLIEVS